MSQYDIIIIGAGPGGYQTATAAAGLGFKVLVVEKQELGGVCLNTGCIPTKTLLKSAKVYNEVLNAAQYGVEIVQPENIKANWIQMQKRKQEVVQKLVGGIGFLFKSNKVEWIKGFAEVMDPNTIKVNDQTYSAKYLFLATGSTPRMLPLPGFEQAYQYVNNQPGFVIDSTGALNLPVIPKHLIVIGGGVIGVEFAILYAKLGTKVTLVQGLDRILEILDNDISVMMTDVLKKAGIEVILNAKVLSVNSQNKTLSFEVNHATKNLTADYVLVSVGRKVNYQGLEKLHLKTDERGLVVVNEQMQTSIPNVYLIGDAVGKVMLAHTAYKHGSIALNAIMGKKEKINYLQIPSCIYSYPEVGSIGYTEEQLIAEKIEYYKDKMPMAALGKALADNSTVGFAKLLIRKDSGAILGCHIIAPTASDMIAEIALAMEAELTVHELASAIHPHPTVSEVIQDLAKHLVYKHFVKK